MTFSVGELVTYWPQQDEAENIHHRAKVVRITPHGRYRIEYCQRDGGLHQTTVGAKRLGRQLELKGVPCEPIS